MNSLRYALFVALITLLQVPTQAQDWVSYQSQQKINDLVDTGGELLMATDVGLVVMNKSSLERTFFNKANSNLADSHIQTITQGASGDTWIGTYDMRLAQFDGTDFSDPIIPDVDFNPNTIQLYDLEVAPNGDLWLGTSQGIFHRQGENWSKYAEAELGADFFAVWDIEITDAGEVFIGSVFIHKFVNGTWSNISNTSNLVSYLDTEIFFSSTGDLYYIGDLDKIGRYDGTQWQEYDNGGLNGSEFIGFAEDVNGNVFFNTRNNGIFKLENDTWMVQEDAQTELYTDNQSNYLYIDGQDRRWLNYNIHLSVNDGGNIQSTLISEHTIESNGIANLHKAANGDMYFLSQSNENISVLDTDGNWSFFPLPSFLLPFSNLADMLHLADNDIWLATWTGLYHYDGTTWTTEIGEACRSFDVDSQGKIYVRASEKFYIIDNGAITEYNAGNSEMLPLLLSGHGIDADDNLWLALFSWDEGVDHAIQKVSPDGTWTTYSEADIPAINRPGSDFHFDVNGNVWVPRDLYGAIKFDGTTWSNPYTDNFDDIDNITVHAIESDATGKVYFSHQYGVTTLLDDEWDNLLIEDVPNENTSAQSYLQFDDAGTLWWASNRHGVFSRTPTFGTSVHTDIEAVNSFSIYPNPAVNQTTLDFAIEESADVNVQVYNYLGQLQANSDLGQLPAGTFQETIDLSRFAKGFYTIQLTINDQISTRKLVVR